jgi:hypothetical protein
MRKTIVEPEAINPVSGAQEEWLDIEKYASIELTSEDPGFPIELALAGRESPAGVRLNEASR